MTKTILITGGHLGPALSCIEELQKRNWHIYFVGRKYTSESSSAPSIESQLIPQMKIDFYPLTTGRLQRHLTLAGIKSLLKLPIGFFQSLSLLSRLKPDVILSFGGYLGFPVCLAGFILGIPVILHEQTTVAGLANRLSSLFATKVAVSWPNITYSFPQSKVVLTGNPAKPELLNSSSRLPRKFSLNPHLPTLIFLGGNQGSHSINQVVIPLLLSLLKFANVILQTGIINGKDYDLACKTPTTNLSGKLIVASFFPPREYATLLRRSDLVIARSGANTVTDIALLGKPAIFIPLPWSGGNEQLHNAATLTHFGAQVISQSTLSPSLLLQTITHSLKNITRLKKLASQSASIIIPHATQRLIDLVESSI